MNTVYQFTLAQVWGGLIALCAAVATISKAFDIIAQKITKAKAPNEEQNRRLAEHDNQISDIKKTLAKHEELFKRDMLHLNDLDDGNRVTQQALLALLSHSLDGNSIEPMRKAKEALEQFLINK